MAKAKTNAKSKIKTIAKSKTKANSKTVSKAKSPKESKVVVSKKATTPTKKSATKVTKKVSTKVSTGKMTYQGKKIDVILSAQFDMEGFKKEEIIELYRLNHLARKLDDKAALYLKMAKGWSYHAPFGGHDGIQMALGKAFRPSKDFLFPYYRDFLTSMAAGLTPVEIILNGLSKSTDVAGGGRHMSNHFAKPEVNVQNVSSCTGNHSVHAAGVGRAIVRYKGDEVVYYSSGEQAIAEGYFYEAIAAADLDKSPVVFVLQNNGFGISVPLEEVSSNMNMAERFIGFPNVKIINVDGLDMFACFKAMNEANKYIKSKKGPVIIHAQCDRIGSHSNSDNQENYRSPEILDTLKRRDPLLQFRYNIIKNKFMTNKELEVLEEENRQTIFSAADIAEAEPDVDPSDWSEFLIPEPAFSGTEQTLDQNADKISLLDGINLVLKQEFRKNEHTYLWGQDIGKGGVFNVVKGMPQEFGKERVFNSAIAENMIVGTANGFTRYRDDIRVVVEGAEFADYFWPAMEQYIELAHEYWRTKGQNVPNVTLRLASGGYIQGGLYHSQTIEAALSSIPGVRIVYPAFADDAIGLMRNCINSKGPTMFLEPKFAYNFKPAYGPTPPDDYIIPFGKAKERKAGTDITVITFGNAVHLATFAANELEKEGVSVQIIDLRSIAPWDKEMVIEAVKKTGRVLVVHEDNLTGGFGGEIASTIAKEAFDYLDAPVNRLGSKDVFVGFAKAYETEILIQIEDVKAAILETVRY